MHIDDIHAAIRKIMDDKNVVSIWYYRQDGAKDDDMAIVQCLTPIVYRQFLHKVERMRVYSVEFTLHKTSYWATKAKRQ